MGSETQGYAGVRKRPNGWVILLILLIHLGFFYVLVRSFAPSAVASVEQSVVSAFTVTVTAPPEPEDPAPEDEGVAGDPGREAVAAPTSAPTPPKQIVSPKPAPRVASTGTANASGATDDGDGTGAAGSGLGTGSGNGGTGRGGGGAVTKPEIASGALNSARDFPIPPGGREARIGTSVIVKVTVLPNGRATDCSVYRSSPFPDTDAAVCRLVVDRLRFRPATNAAGEPVAAPFYYQQRFFN